MPRAVVGLDDLPVDVKAALNTFTIAVTSARRESTTRKSRVVG
jgi:hypothetical protein